MSYFPNFESDASHGRSDTNLPRDTKLPGLQGVWEALGISVPTISAFAYICAQSILERSNHKSTTDCDVSELAISGPAKTILYAAKQTGSFELKVTPRAFRTTERYLALHVHTSEDESAVFQNPDDLKLAVEFLEAFREICHKGFCIHQLHGEFSLNHRGFEVAQSIQKQEVELWLSKIQNSSQM